MRRLRYIHTARIISKVPPPPAAAPAIVLVFELPVVRVLELTVGRDVDDAPEPIANGPLTCGLISTVMPATDSPDKASCK